MLGLDAKAISYGDSLTLLLTVESLLLAVLGLAVTLGTPDGKRVRRLPVSAGWIAAVTVAAICLAGLGSMGAWYEIFVRPGYPRGTPGQLVAWALFLTILIEPALALLLALGMRTAE
jgi:hypothetical protein